MNMYEICGNSFMVLDAEHGLARVSALASAAVGSSLWAGLNRLFPWAQAAKLMWLAPRPNRV
jgi:hypothetical protein